jgi:(p)ppGpp synthase/HD superfamily hydrolase
MDRTENEKKPRSRLSGAFDFAYQLHSHQRRKGTHIPYIAHLMAVSALVLEANGDEDQVIAALLHDAAEDQGGIETLNHIRTLFGERVARIVEGCSDTLVSPKPPWRKRKETYLKHLQEAPSEVVLVSLADKLHNARSILRDIQRNGTAIFDKFNGGKAGTLWYYRRLVEIFQTMEKNFLIDEFSEVVNQIISASEEGA